MKIIFTILFSLCIGLMASAQDGRFDVSYGFNITRFYTGSGHGSNYVINSNIQKGRRSLEIGMVYKENDVRVSGGDAKFKVFIGKNGYKNNLHKNKGISLKPYLQYNCIYQNSKVNTPNFIPVGFKKTSFPELPSSPGTVSSMEHYTGFGMQVFIAKNICFDGSIGIGAYIGAIDHYNHPGTIGIHNENSGFVMSFDFGLGYKFGV